MILQQSTRIFIFEKRGNKELFSIPLERCMKTRIPVNTFTRPLNLQLPIRQRPNSRQKRGSPLPFAPSIEKMGRYFPRHSSRTPFNVPNVGRLPAETTTVERIYIYIYSPSSRFAAPWRRSARRASFVPSSFSLSSSGELLLFSVARQLARSGPSYASSLEQQANLITNLTNLARRRGCCLDFVEMFGIFMSRNRYRCCIYLSVFQYDSSVGNGRRRF